MQDLIDEKEFEVKKKWQDYNRYYIVMYICVISVCLSISLTNKFWFDLPLWVAKVLVPAYLFVLPLVFCLLMFRRAKNDPILNTGLIAKSITALLTSSYVAMLTFIVISSLVTFDIQFITTNIFLSLIKIIVVYLALLIIAFCTLLPLSSLYNKHFPRKES